MCDKTKEEELAEEELVRYMMKQAEQILDKEVTNNEK